MFVLCKYRSCEKCGRHFCKLLTCSNIAVTFFLVGFVSVLNRQVYVVGVLFVSWFGRDGECKFGYCVLI